jgi:hypothetical protein
MSKVIESNAEFIAYEWQCLKAFGYECWRSWKQELLIGLIMAVAIFAITWGVDPTALTTLRTALRGTALVFVVLATWNILRVPWIVHRDGSTTANHSIPRRYGLLGIVVSGGLLCVLLFCFWRCVHHTATASPPAVKPVIQSSQPKPLPCTPKQTDAPRHHANDISTKQVIKQDGHNNQANPFVVNGNQTTNGAGSSIVNGSNDNLQTSPQEPKKPQTR